MFTFKPPLRRRLTALARVLNVYISIRAFKSEMMVSYDVTHTQTDTEQTFIVKDCYNSCAS